MPSDFAKAIAHAEGFNVQGSIPQRAHNPLDLAIGDVGFGTIGPEKITVFENDAAGWAAGEHQLDLIRNRRSHIYTPATTLEVMAQHWTPKTWKIWLANVIDWFMEHGRSQTTAQTVLKDLLG